MSRLKNLSRGGYIAVGIVMTLILVPTGIAAAAVAYNGIEGTNGTTTTVNDARVTSAGQLTTTEAAPSAYRDYTQVGELNSAEGLNGGSQCLRLTSIPTGDAFVVRQAEVDARQVDASTSVGSPTGYSSNSFFLLTADSPSNACGDGSLITTGETPNVGNVAIPLTPGYVLPSGFKLDAYGHGLNGFFYVTGYLVPSADAPTTPG